MRLQSVSLLLAVGIALTQLAAAQVQGPVQGPVRITLDEAVQLALQHNHNQLALMTTIQQSQAEEITQGLAPQSCALCGLGVFTTGLALPSKLESVFRCIYT